MSAAWISDCLARQIQIIRMSGKCNMADGKAVQVAADTFGFHGLVVFLEEHPGVYLRYILTGIRS